MDRKEGRQRGVVKAGAAPDETPPDDPSSQAPFWGNNAVRGRTSSHSLYQPAAPNVQLTVPSCEHRAARRRAVGGIESAHSLRMPTPLPPISILTMTPSILEICIFHRSPGSIEIGEAGLEVTGKNNFRLPLPCSVWHRASTFKCLCGGVPFIWVGQSFRISNIGRCGTSCLPRIEVGEAEGLK